MSPLLWAVPALATVQVNGTGTAHNTIAEALDAALPGDVLHVSAGTYDESVVVDKDITILGLGGVTWNGASGDEVIALTDSADLTLENLVVRDGSLAQRRAIYAAGNNVVVLQDVDILGDSLGAGGALYAINPSSITVRGSWLSGVAAAGGAIFATKSSSYPLSIEDTTFQFAVATSDGGAIYAHNALLTCTRCTFQDTWADGWGGAIFSNLGSLTIEQSLFCAAEAPTGRGGAIASGSTATLRANLFVGTRSGMGGGALYIGGGTWVVENNHFLGAYMGPDTGAIEQMLGSATIRNNLFFANDGYGISRLGGSGTVTYNWFQDNALGHASFVLDSTNYADAGDPLLISWSRTGNCAGDQLWPTPIHSPVLEAGDPALFDPDGSRSNIGAYGGVFADRAFHEDADGDGDSFFHDCDDTDYSRSAHQPEACDEVDNDCDELVDEEAWDVQSFSIDCDGDGQGVPDTEIITCFEPAHAPPDCRWSLTAADCDDSNATVYAGAPELCDTLDNDCDGFAETETVHLGFVDHDGDGFGTGEVVEFCGDLALGYVLAGGDCDDADRAVYPGQPELCNGLDDDCNGLLDDAGPEHSWYPDLDGDGYGDTLSEAWASCPPGEDWQQGAGDCNDADDTVHPGVPELCNGLDDDCSGTIDDGPIQVWFPDEDGDGYGDEADPHEGSCPVGSGVTVGGDCDDDSASVHPGAAEVCNGLDDDCAQGADNVGTFGTWYKDGDGDGLGTGEGAVQAACSPGPGWSAEPGDCDDEDASVSWECDYTGCACGQASLGPGWMALLVMLGARRRR